MKFIIGLLSPEGKFYECDSYGHLSLAEDLCATLYKKTDFYHSVECEDYLIKKGFIVFQARHVYNGFFEITKEQFDFIKSHTDDFNESQRIEVNNLLFYSREVQDEEN